MTEIAIIGGGIGGLAAAAFLRRAGLRATVYEQAGRLGEVGAGVVVAPNAARLLRSLGVLGALTERAVPLDTGWEFRRWQDGRVLSAEDLATKCARLYGERTYTAHRADLLDAIGRAVPGEDIRLGKRCTGLDRDGERHLLRFDDGTSAAADVVIGADGIHSVLQGFVVAPAEPVFSGVVAYRGLVPRLEEYPAGTIRMWMGEGQHFLVFPVRAGQLLNYVGFVPSQTAVRESWSASGDPAALAAHFAGWDPVIGQVIAAISGPGGSGFQWGMYDRVPLPRWSSGRLTLLGDAAHPMLPHLGQGVNQALEDAVALATLLGASTSPAGVPRALTAYEGLRRDRTARVQLGSRRQGAGYDSSGRQLIDRRWIYDYDAWAEAVALT